MKACSNLDATANIARLQLNGWHLFNLGPEIFKTHKPHFKLKFAFRFSPKNHQEVKNTIRCFWRNVLGERGGRSRHCQSILVVSRTTEKTRGISECVRHEPGKSRVRVNVSGLRVPIRKIELRVAILPTTRALVRPSLYLDSFNHVYVYNCTQNGSCYCVVAWYRSQRWAMMITRMVAQGMVNRVDFAPSNAAFIHLVRT